MRTAKAHTFYIFPFPSLQNTKTPKHKNTQTQKHLNTKTPKHKNTQTLKHPNPQSYLFHLPEINPHHTNHFMMMTNQSLEDNLFKNSNDDKLYVTESISEQWRQISKWTYGMAFIGFLFLLLLAFALFGILTSMPSVPAGFYLGIFLVAFFVFAISRNLYRFSWRIKNAANYSDWTDLENGFNNFWWVHALYGSLMVLLCLFFLGGLAFFSYRAYM